MTQTDNPVIATRIDTKTHQAILSILRLNPGLNVSDYIRDLIEKDLQRCPQCRVCWSLLIREKQRP